MTIGVVTESVGGGDQSWLGSRHGVVNARTGTLKASAFTDKFVPSGMPVAKDGDTYVPYTGTNTLIGFVLNDTTVAHGDAPVAILDHGRVIAANVPGDFTAPADAGAFIFV